MKYPDCFGITLRSTLCCLRNESLCCKPGRRPDSHCIFCDFSCDLAPCAFQIKVRIHLTTLSLVFHTTCFFFFTESKSNMLWRLSLLYSTWWSWCAVHSRSPMSHSKKSIHSFLLHAYSKLLTICVSIVFLSWSFHIPLLSESSQDVNTMRTISVYY